VVVGPGTGALTVQLTRGGTDGGKLQAAQGEIEGRETFRVLYPADRISYTAQRGDQSTQLHVREDGTFDGGECCGRHWRGRRVSVSSQGDGLAAYADLRVQVPKGARIEINLAVGKVAVTNVDGDVSIEAHGAPVTTSGTRGELGIDVGSGSVQVTSAAGELSVDTGSGRVEVTRFRGRTFSVSTGSGEVTASDVHATTLSVETGSGEVRLTGASSPTVVLETGSGSVTAELQADIRSLAVETGSGDVSIKAPPGLGAEVEIETSSGDIETDFPLQVTRHSRDHLMGRIGDGNGRIAIETGSGEVRLLKAGS